MAHRSPQSSKARNGLPTEAFLEDLKGTTSFGGDTIGREPSRPKMADELISLANSLSEYVTTEHVAATRLKIDTLKMDYRQAPAKALWGRTNQQCQRHEYQQLPSDERSRSS